MYQHIVEFYQWKGERYRKDKRWLDRYLYFSGVVHRYKQIMLNGVLSLASIILNSEELVWVLLLR